MISFLDADNADFSFKRIPTSLYSDKKNPRHLRLTNQSIYIFLKEHYE